MTPRGIILGMTIAVGWGTTTSCTQPQRTHDADAETKPRLVVVAGTPGEGAGAAVSAGLAIEITHALQTVPDLVVRPPGGGPPRATHYPAGNPPPHHAG